MDKLPKRKYWYHGTSVDCVPNIVAEGLRGWGIYFANTRNYAANFARQQFNTPLEFTPEQNQLRYGVKHKPTAEKIAVLKIATDRIPEIELSYDHSPVFYPKDLVCAVSFADSISVDYEDVCDKIYVFPKTEWKQRPDGCWVRCEVA